MRTKPGQALIELALGTLVLAILVSALTGMAVYMVRSLRAQNTARIGTAEGNGSVKVDIFLGGRTVEKLQVDEKVTLPNTGVR